LATSASVAASRAALRLQWDDGTQGEFASVWLRDNLPEDRDRFSGQRLIDVTDLPAEPRIRAVTLNARTLQVIWQTEARVSEFGLDWLYAHADGRWRSPAPVACHWLEGSRLNARADFAWRPLAAIARDPEARLRWLTRLLRDGIAFLSEVPQVESGLVEAMALVGRVAETNYGLVFDVRAVPQPENLAYSDVGLGLHTDNPYREPVPGFQALHTLLAAPDGGDSLFADGLALAEELRRTEPSAFEMLTRTAVPFHYRSRSADLYAERPLIALDCSGSVLAVHYNSRSMGPLHLTATDCEAFYGAYRRWAALLRDPRFQLTTRLRDGELVVFDNQRVLHGRTAFASARHARHLRGCYLTRDSVYSEQAVLQRRRARAAGEEP
jgi:gamma-butyrobetaine dioxygenase